MRKLLVGVVVVSSAVGCAQPLAPKQAPTDDRVVREDGDDDIETPRALFSDDIFSIRSLGGRLDGTVGPAIVSHDAEWTSVYSDGTYTSADLTVRGDQGSAMGILSISGGLDMLAAGEHTRTCMDDYNDPGSDVNNGGVAVQFVGCANSGQPEDGWDYDMPADCTDVVVMEPGPDAPEETVGTVMVLAHWENGGDERTVKAQLHLTQ